MKKTIISLGIILAALLPWKLFGQQPAAFGPLPNEYQLRWQKMEYYAFIHFSMNTFTDIEWGYGDRDPKLFKPSELDCRQWARICKEAGMKGIILTAKHHDGFCLWPSKYTEYSVKQSPWKGGKGDLVADLAAACKEYGLKLGIYLSPWDRNHADYGKPEYIAYFRNQLTELLGNYGEIFEVWFDGANGGSGYYGGARETRNVDRKTYYDWENTIKLVRRLQPSAMIFSDGGPDVRWCGDEEGWVGETNWSLLRRGEVWPGYPRYEELRYGHEDGTHWVPAEVNVSTRPGWFYHRSEDHQVKTVPELLDIYYQSIGRNGTMLINFPVDTRGLIHERDAENILALRKAIDADLAVDLAKGMSAKASSTRGGLVPYSAAKVVDGDDETYWTTDDGVTRADLEISFGQVKRFNRLLLQEYIKLGQRVSSFSVEAELAGNWKEISRGTTIGYKRILRFPSVDATAIRLRINEAKAIPLISNLSVYNAPVMLSMPVIKRDKDGMFSLSVADKESRIYYTTNGNTPDTSARLYTGSFKLDGKVLIKAIGYDAKSGRYGPFAAERFDISKAEWKVSGREKHGAAAMFDGDSQTAAIFPAQTLPLDLTVDLGATYNVKAFTYLPDQSRYAKGIIFNYEFYVSADGKTWRLTSAGEFSNIRNNPVLQTKHFNTVRARYVRLRALSTTTNDGQIGIAGLDLITE